MATNAAATRSYRASQWAVLPGSAVRGGVVGLLYGPVVVILYAHLAEQLQDTEYISPLEAFHEAVGFGGVALIGFAVPVVASVVLAFAGFGRRRYRIGPEAVTERRGLLFRTDRTMTYDEVDSVTFSQSWAQRLYNTGTIRVTDVDAETDVERTVRLRYVDDPEAVYTTVLRRIADARGVTPGEIEPPDVGEVPTEADELSRLSSERLAAGTGFSYLLPIGILSPRPWAAAKHAALVGATHAVAGAAVLYVLRSPLSWAVAIPSDAYFGGLVLLGAVAYTCALSGYYYWRNDRRQYELYEDHVRVVDGDRTGTVSLSDVAAIDRAPGLVRDDDTGHVVLRNAEGEELCRFEFLPDLDRVHASLQQWLDAATGADDGAEDLEDGDSTADGGDASDDGGHSTADENASRVADDGDQAADDGPADQEATDGVDVDGDADDTGAFPTGVSTEDTDQG